MRKEKHVRDSGCERESARERERQRERQRAQDRDKERKREKKRVLDMNSENMSRVFRVPYISITVITRCLPSRLRGRGSEYDYPLCVCML